MISMCRFLVNILLVVCFALPSWGRYAGLAYVGEVEWNKRDKTSFMLQCDTTATDTVWSLKLQGFVTTGYMLLIKTGDGKVLELDPYDLKTDHVTDSVGHSPITGEIMEFYHYEHVLYYHITGTALNYIAEHGISKLRCGYDALYRDKEFRRNEFGNDLTKAYKKILERMSPDYVPPQKPSIRDGF